MSLNILFMGTPEFAIPILESIHYSQHNLLAVYTQPPKKKFRGQNVVSSPVQQFAEKIRIPIRSPNNLDTEEEYDFIKNLKPDIVVVVAYGKILSSKILNLLKIYFINVHASLLPRWRGAAPIQRAIMNMDKETGISIIKIVKELDAGPIMKFKKIDIKQNTTFKSLSQEMSNLSSSMILDCLDIIEKKNEKFINQDHRKATYAKKIDKSETKINWNNPAKKIVAKINSLYPIPGCWFELDGSRVKVLQAKEIKGKGKPGEIINDQFSVACSENAIQILQLKKEGKNTVSASNFLIGNKLKVGRNLNEI